MASVTTVGPGDGHAEALLEAGQVLVLWRADLVIAEADLAFLRMPNRVSAKHKNVAYDPRRQRVFGLPAGDPQTSAALRRILSRYAAQMTQVVAALCPRYAPAWSVDLTSFRPLEEADRRLSARARNDRLHIDAFPSRPTHGGRILRAFTNIHPTRPRCWLSGDPLHQVLPSLRQCAGFPLPRPHRLGGVALRRRVAQGLGIPALGRSAYDRYMLRVHDFMKQSDEFLQCCQPARHEFAPFASWVVFTDSVPHAVLSGQYAVEQTYIVPRTVLLAPERSPLALFEQLAGVPLVAR